MLSHKVYGESQDMKEIHLWSRTKKMVFGKSFRKNVHWEKWFLEKIAPTRLEI